jgi:predicted permease
VSTIKDEVPALDIGRRRFTLRNFFVVAQVAVSMILLVGAGLCIRNLSSWRRIDPGFESERAALAVVDVERAGYATEEEGRGLFERYRERLASSPGVEAVAITSHIPFGLWGMDKTPVHLPGEEPESEEDLKKVDFARVSEEYFDTLGIPILRGRSFSSRDTESSSPVAIVSESMASQFWGSTDVIGETVILGPLDETETAEVVGVARDTVIRIREEEPDPYLYLPFSQHYTATAVFVTRTFGDPAAMPETFRRELQALDYRVPIFEAKTMSEHLGIILYLPQMTVVLLSSFGILALVLASIGLYGLIAFSVTQRTREVGIRIALGARAQQVVTMVMKEGIGLVATGLAVGLLIAALITRPLSKLLMDVSATDPMTYATVALLLFGVTVLAVIIPARRAAKADPMAALRHE